MQDITDYRTKQVMSIDIISSSEENDIDDNNNNNLDYARIYFDAHANIVVLGKNCHITNHTGRKA